ncbi:hypothetical protein GZL_01305 [Streptomyces sp. 769]|nr:hypothetical protein GZL_01305 [Streptomyces sp. 769]
MLLRVASAPADVRLARTVEDVSAYSCHGDPGMAPELTGSAHV